jgi:hypothetical protein
MYKKFAMEHTLTMVKFRSILGSFRSVHDRDRLDGGARRRGLNDLMRLQRIRYAEILYDIENTMTSLDDDKQRMRSFKCDEEDFVRVRHAKGGFGPVQHVAVSQLTHCVLGFIINSKGSTDAASMQQLLFDLDVSAQVPCDTNHHGAPFFLDRGYQKDGLMKIFDNANCSVLGTIQRQKSAATFPYTFEHPEQEHNVPNDGIPVAMYSRNGSHVGLVYRGFQSKKPVLLRTTMPMLTVPLTATYVPPPPPEAEDDGDDEDANNNGDNSLVSVDVVHTNTTIDDILAELSNSDNESEGGVSVHSIQESENSFLAVMRMTMGGRMSSPSTRCLRMWN